MMKKRQSKGILVTVILLFIGAATIFPFYIMICMGTYSSADLFKGIPLLPGKELLNNLKTITDSSFGRFYLNSFAASITATAAGILTSAMAGYALSKYRFRFRESVIRIILAMMMIPSQISLIAYVMEMRALHLSNTLWPVIIPFTYSAFGVYWMKQSMDSSVPDEVIESARIDGAAEIRIFFSIVLPFVRSALVTIALLLFMWSWNSYLLPLITISDMKFYTVPLGVAMLDGMYRSDYAVKILALSLGTLPIILMFGFGSKYFIRGLTGGAVKG